jgi:drug/metabolite transporter (DMT)-like permease
LLSGVGQAVIAVVSLSALRYIPAATLAFLFYTYPAWVAIIARVRHSEPLTPTRLFALALSLAGIFVMVGAPGGATLHPGGVALALVAALLYAAYIPLINALQRGLTPLATATYMSLGAAIVLSAAAATRGQLAVAIPSSAWLPVLGLALISTVAAFFLFLSGLRVLGPVRTAIISTIEPFFTALLSAWVLGQPLSPTTLFGGVFIAAAVVLLQLRANNSGP